MRLGPTGSPSCARNLPLRVLPGCRGRTDETPPSGTAPAGPPHALVGQRSRSRRSTLPAAPPIPGQIGDAGGCCHENLRRIQPDCPVPEANTLWSHSHEPLERVCVSALAPFAWTTGVGRRLLPKEQCLVDAVAMGRRSPTLTRLTLLQDGAAPEPVHQGHPVFARSLPRSTRSACLGVQDVADLREHAARIVLALRT